jgi:16S rRNA processing protein RimM
VRGDVVIDLITDRTERLAPGSVLQSDRGPFEVIAARPHQGKWIVQLKGMVDRAQVEDLRGLVLRAEPIADDEGALWVHELIGSEVTLADGTIVGTVAEVEANPASDLLVLGDGRLVPIVFVTTTEPGRVTIDPPDGLLDL